MGLHLARLLAFHMINNECPLLSMRPGARALKQNQCLFCSVKLVLQLRRNTVATKPPPWQIFLM